jgi:hypothetical protein
MRECEYTYIYMALIEYPQGNPEEIQQKTLLSTQEEPGGRQDRKAQAYSTERYEASCVPLARTQARQYVHWFRQHLRPDSLLRGQTYVHTLGQVKAIDMYTVWNYMFRRLLQCRGRFQYNSVLCSRAPAQ